MFSIGKINPDNSRVGSIRAKAEMNMATCWLPLTVDIMIPRESANDMKRMVSKTRRVKLPRMGS